jgi:hypothetical protein
MASDKTPLARRPSRSYIAGIGIRTKLQVIIDLVICQLSNLDGHCGRGVLPGFGQTALEQFRAAIDGLTQDLEPQMLQSPFTPHSDRSRERRVQRPTRDERSVCESSPGSVDRTGQSRCGLGDGISAFVRLEMHRCRQ